jgi:hypothetical protein
MGVRLAGTLARGDFRADLAVSVADGVGLWVLGPNGAG